jgi:hypothetical protein
MDATDRRNSVLALGLADWYGEAMSWSKIRRISTLLAAWILAAGLVAHGFGGPDIIVKSATTATHNMPMSGDMPMPGKCNGCAGDERGVALAACTAFCGVVIAVPLIAVVPYAVPAEILSPTAGTDAIGRADSPDPYPPRPTILS